VVAPPAVKVIVEPAQTVGLLTVTVGLAITVTVLVFVELHVPEVPVIVYTIVLDGFAVTLELVVELKPVPGLQL
jgi:hypothetical protein